MAHKQHRHDHDNGRKTTAAEVALRERIQLRAYELFETAPGGSAMEDWLRAEREVRGGAAAALRPATQAGHEHD